MSEKSNEGKKEKTVLLALSEDEFASMLGSYEFVREVAKFMVTDNLASAISNIDMAKLNMYLSVAGRESFHSLKYKFNDALHNAGLCTNPECPHKQQDTPKKSQAEAYLN